VRQLIVDIAAFFFSFKKRQRKKRVEIRLMYPNQQYYQAGGGRGAPYPQQPPYGPAQGFAG